MKKIPTRRFVAIDQVKGPVVITGGGGMLGCDLAETFAGRKDVHVLDRAALDIAGPGVLAALDKYRPSVVINAAAYTNVDGAETEREAAHAGNARGPAQLARACRELGIKLVHFSTDQVFDGTVPTPRSETDPVNPANNYAATKYEGERAVLENADALVLRVQWLYGARKDRFTPLRDKAVFTPFADQYGAPTWTRDLAAVTTQLMSRDARGLFHFAYDDYASWAEVFQFVKDELGLSVQLQPRQTAEVKLPARRPLFSVMSNRKLVSFLGLSGMGSWKDSLREFLQSR
jgi:dTDP-4-dehydrorhamnose reductase